MCRECVGVCPLPNGVSLGSKTWLINQRELPWMTQLNIIYMYYVAFLPTMTAQAREIQLGRSSIGYSVCIVQCSMEDGVQVVYNTFD